MALDAGIVARAEPSRRWRLRAPDLGVDAPLEDVATGGGAALLCAAAAAAREEFRVAQPFTVTVRGSTAGSRRKHGLGGSAASVVAVLAALAAVSGVDVEGEAARRKLFSLALSVHRAHQRGRGSGADVATSVYGGWVDYAIEGAAARIARATLPEDVQLAAVWSGVASDTRARDRRLRAARPSRRAARGARAVLGRRSALPIAMACFGEIDAYGRALESFGAGAGAESIARLSAVGARIRLGRQG